MLLEKKIVFWDFRVFDFVLYPKSKTRNLEKCSATSNFDSSCNLRFRNDKSELRQKLKGQDMLLEVKYKISEISEFLVLSYTQNRKLGISESVLLLQILTVAVI